MKNIVKSYVEKYDHERLIRRRILTALLILALVVSGSVFWQLRSDGVAMANETYCGQEEHLHGPECYEEVLVCGLEESEGTEGHVHTKDCYEEVLICDIPEHVHTIACMSDESADLESAADWEATLPYELSGRWAEDVLAVAESQLGYTESESNFVISEDDGSRKGYTRYGAWYGNPYGDWDAMFASFCLYYAGVPEEVFPEGDGCWAWVKSLKGMGLYEDAAGYIPEPGDLVFFGSSGDGNSAGRVGIVEEVKYVTDADGEAQAAGFTAIEGDSLDAVERSSYELTDGAIAGYGALPENPDAPVAEDETDIYEIEEISDVAEEESEEAETPEEDIDADADEYGAVPLAEGIGDVLDGDYAYLTGVAMDGGSNGGYAMTTGTAPWDDDDDAGDDMSADNRILRTYDTATYNVTMGTLTREDAPCGVYVEGDLYFEFVVMGTAGEVQWEAASMGWLESKHGVYTLSEEKYDSDSDGEEETYQVLRGYITLGPATSEGHAIGETVQTLSIVLRALALQNGDTLVPRFTFFLAYNDVGLTEAQYKAWGTSGYNGPIVTFEGENCATDGGGDTEAHGQEYQTVIAPMVTISAAPRYNLALVNSTASKTQQMGTYDFSTGNDLALDKNAGNYYGRLGSYGLVLQIVGKDETRGLRGVELPAEGEDLTVSFTLSLSSTYTSGTTVYETGTTSNGRDLTAYKPLIWSFDENKTGSSQQDNRSIPVTTKYADQVPYNNVSDNGSDNPANYWYASCADGGTWRIADNGDGTYAVTITYCKVDMDQLPYVYPGAGTSLSYKYYNPNNINYDPSDGSKNNYWEVQTACLSAGEIWVVQPYYAGEKDDGTTYIAQMLGEGTFSVTLNDTVLEVKQGDDVLLNGNKEQSVTTDDTQGQSMALVNPGSIDQHIAYIKYDYSAYNDPLTDGCFSSAKDWILQGDRLGIETYVTNDSAEEGNTGVAYDVMIKFDDAFFEPDGTIRFNGKLNGEDRNYLWAAKPDGSGWDHGTLSPDEAGYDTEMINATPDDLAYFSSLDSLKEAGYTCVGVLVQYRGLMTEQQNHIHTYLLGTSSAAAESDQVYMVTPYCRSWDRDDLAAAMAQDEGGEYYGNESAALSALLGMTTSEVKTVVNQYIPTRTADNGGTLKYEDGSGNAVDYPSAHWINGDSRHPTTAAGGSSRTPTILNYVKCYYDENGCHEGTSGNYWGDSCLMVGYKSGLTMKVAQQTTGGNGETQDKSVFDMDTSQTVVDYEVSPFIETNNGEGSSETQTYTEVVVKITLPENLTYIEGSSYIGGDYSTAKEGEQGTVTGGVQLTEGTAATFTYTVDGVSYTVGVILTVGEGSLTYTFTDVPVTGTQEMQFLENIFFSCEISSGAVKNGDQLDVTADISCTSDQGIEPASRENGEAIVGITVTKNTAISLVKTADETAVDVNDEIGYTIDVGDNSENEMTMVAVDNLPYYGDGTSTFMNEDCKVYVTEFSAYDVTIARDLSGFYFFYTTNPEYAGMTSADYPNGEYFVTGLGTEDEEVNEHDDWFYMEMDQSEHDTAGHSIYSYTGFPEEQVYVIVGVGIIEGTDDINMHVTLKLSDSDPGDSVVNKVSQQHSVTTTDDEGNPVEAYENLIDSARVRVVGRTVSGYVWLDEDVDGGIRTGMYENEQMLAGVDVKLQIKNEQNEWTTARKLKDDRESYEAGPARLDAEDGEEGLECTTTTDEEGYYEFRYVPEGEFRVVISGTGTGDISKREYALEELSVTTYEAEDIEPDKNSKVERSDETDPADSIDYIDGITLPTATAISGTWYYDEYENGGYTAVVPFTVNKRWLDLDGEDMTDGKTAGSITVQITADVAEEDQKLTRQVVLDKDNNWTYTINDLPYYDGNGELIDYEAVSFTINEIEGNEGSVCTVGEIVKNDDGRYSVTVTNGAISELPKAGGAGRIPFTAAGLALIGGSGLILIRKRRAVVRDE